MGALYEFDVLVKARLIAEEIRVKIICRETIKPSSPTPDHLRNFNLSLLDQLAPVAYAPLVLFYSKNGNTDAISEVLKSSLSETLTRFYPLAGRIRDEDSSIVCNDEGAIFVEARVNCNLQRFVARAEAQDIRKLIPVEIGSPQARTGCLLFVQATSFECGGLAIGVCISHKVADAATLNTFIQGWSASALGRDQSVKPLLNAASIFPPNNHLSFTKPPVPGPVQREKYETRRFVFDGPKISALKAKATGEAVRNPTRVEAITSLIWKCAMNASRSNRDPSKMSILSQSVNLRGKTSPPLPEHTLGDLAGHFASEAMESEVELKDVVRQLREGLQQFNQNYVKKLQGNNSYEAISESFKEAGKLLQQGNIDLYICTSLCRYRFYEVDFGWGKPWWATIPTGVYKNVIVLVDSRDGEGVEAWVTLSPEDMWFFQRDPELLAFASRALTKPTFLKSPL